MLITQHKKKLAATQTITFDSSQCVCFCRHLILSFEISFQSAKSVAKEILCGKGWPVHFGSFTCKRNFF